MCQKCLAVSAGFRSNDQLITYRGSTFPESRATTPGSRHWERAQFQDNPSCITLMSSGLHLPARLRLSILSVVVRRAVFGTRIYACTTNRIVRVHGSVFQSVEDAAQNFFLRRITVINVVSLSFSFFFLFFSFFFFFCCVLQDFLNKKLG